MLFTMPANVHPVVLSHTLTPPLPPVCNIRYVLHGVGLGPDPHAARFAGPELARTLPKMRADLVERAVTPFSSSRAHTRSKLAGRLSASASMPAECMGLLVVVFTSSSDILPPSGTRRRAGQRYERPCTVPELPHAVY